MKSSSKRLIASVAALQILLYHCWIPVFPYGTAVGSAERFLVASTYSGVDMFFFISAYSLVSRPVDDYGAFLKNRALKLLPLFAIALLAGQFLWFIPSIMVLYLVLPPLYKRLRTRPRSSFFLLLIAWAGIVYLVLGVLRPAQDLGIFLFRIPSMILGAYAVKFRDKFSTATAVVVGTQLLVLGMVLVYHYGYINRISYPFRSMFYLTGIPVMLGTVLILDAIARNRRIGLADWFGSITLELYFTQMVLGTLLINLFFRITGSRILTNIAVMAIIIAAAEVIKICGNKITNLIQRRWSMNDSQKT